MDWCLSNACYTDKMLATTNGPTIRKCSIKKYDEFFYKNIKQLFQWETVYDVIIAMIPRETDPEMEIYAQECY